MSQKNDLEKKFLSEQEMKEALAEMRVVASDSERFNELRRNLLNSAINRMSQGGADGDSLRRLQDEVDGVLEKIPEADSQRRMAAIGCFIEASALHLKEAVYSLRMAISSKEPGSFRH